MKNKLHFDFRKLCFALALILAQCGNYTLSVPSDKAVLIYS